jgi:hypothetical protein
MRPEVKNLRKNVFDFLNQSVLPNAIKSSHPVLEIGPMQEQWTPIKEYFVDTRKYYSDQGIQYLSSDIDKSSGSDIICDILDLKNNVQKGSVQSIIALEVIEHVSKIWELSEIFSHMLIPNGKIFISTPYYFFRHAPFPDYWRISEDGLRLLFEENFSLEINALIDDDERKPLHYTLIGTKK